MRHAAVRFAALSTFLYRRSTFYLLLLLVPPLLWLGTVYLGTLFALLMQSIYSIDEFTAQIVRKPTLATYKQLFTQPANIDIVLRTLTMAVCVTIAAAVIAFPIANYMVRYASPRRRALFYVAVLLPMWTSYLVKVYAWRLILAKQGILSWMFEAVGAEACSTRILQLPGIGGPSLSLVLSRHVHRVRLHVAAVHDPAGRGCARARAGIAAAGVGGSRRAARADVAHGDPAARDAGARGGLGVHVLADARRLHHPEHRRRAGLLHRHDGVSAAGHGRKHSARRGVSRVVPIVLIAIYLTLAKRFGAFDAL